MEKELFRLYSCILPCFDLCIYVVLRVFMCVCIIVLLSFPPPPPPPLLPQALVRLPPHLSDDEFVLNFFELRPEDFDDPTSVDEREGGREGGMGR